MHLANSLNAEHFCTCVHEGQFRHRETSGEQLLPFLTLENRIAYESPEKAQEIVEKKRAILDELEMSGASHFGDIAYNNSPFLVPLSLRFPQAKFIVIIRDGRSFVRSATVLHSEDETPVGWPPREKETTRLEDYISLGRLQPRKGSPLAHDWPNWDAFQQNVWLWAETNQLIIDGLQQIPAERWLCIRFEDLVADQGHAYGKIREFLEFDQPWSEEAKSVLMSPTVNASRSYDIPDYRDWTDAQKAHFRDYAGPVMAQLEYSYD